MFSFFPLSYRRSNRLWSWGAGGAGTLATPWFCRSSEKPASNDTSVAYLHLPTIRPLALLILKAFMLLGFTAWWVRQNIFFIFNFWHEIMRRIAPITGSQGSTCLFILHMTALFWSGLFYVKGRASRFNAWTPFVQIHSFSHHSFLGFWVA